MSCLVDTSCLVALICSTHEHHERTRAELDARVRRAEALAVSAHGLVETYAVLTRLPPPMRLTPVVAEAALRAGWRRAQTIGLTAVETWSVLGGLPGRAVAGGRTYDALIAACAKKAAVDTLLTWNTKHFEALADGFAVAAPK